MLTFVLALAFSAGAFASDLARAPESFTVQGARAVYVDFQELDAKITYDLRTKSASVVTTIRFEAQEAGQPIFDLRPEATSIELDGFPAGALSVKTPDNATTVRVLQTHVAPGAHELVVRSPLVSLVDWKSDGVHSAFWMSDLSDRQYLEQFLPANLEFDQYAMTFEVKFLNASKRQVLYTNGVVEELSGQHFMVRFPPHFTASSVFFHTAPEGVMAEERFSFTSIDGRELPVVIYLRPSLLGSAATQLARVKAETLRVLQELEADYGPFLHPSLTIYNAGQGGMEYCGATITSFEALGHELIHSYFARGVMPANGNAGWIDEAIASWRDRGYPRGTGFSGSANLANMAPYTRTTARAAYGYGATFMSNLDAYFSEQGGLKSLLRRLVQERAFMPFITEDFIDWAQGHYRAELVPLFKRHVFSGSSTRTTVEESVHHRKLTEAELRELL